MWLYFSVSHPIALYYNNKVAVSIARNLVQHNLTKYIEVDCQFINKQLKSRCVSASFLKKEGQLVDVLTKVLSGVCLIDIVGSV